MSRRLLPKDFDEEVLQCCLDESYRYGLERISTKRIAALLGVSEPVIFLHFKDKKNLLNQAFLRAWQPFDDFEKIPVFVSLLGVDEAHQQEVFGQVKKALRFKKEFIFLAQYDASINYYDFDLVYKTLAKRRARVMAAFEATAKVSPTLRLDLVSCFYMSNFIAMMSHLGKGDYALNPDNVARLLNGLLYGMKGYLKGVI